MKPSSINSLASETVNQFDQIKAMVAKAASECDMVILNAGSSAGREDFSAKVIRELGQVLYHGIAIKPGKPAILGAMGAKPILGVPGYPVSGIIVIEQLLKPLIDHWLKVPAVPSQYAKAILTRPVVSGLKYEEFVRAMYFSLSQAVNTFTDLSSGLA